MMTEKGCDNCYYSYFDEKAYPCSLCIRGIERTDQWQPSKKTKAEAQTEVKVEPTWEGLTYGRFEAEPQTEVPTAPGKATHDRSQILVPLPFYFCKRCKLFELTCSTIMADGEPCGTVYRCANEEMCENIVRNIDRAERSE